MIVFDLSCGEGHRFEGWFGSSDDFAAQQARGLVGCPRCGSAEIEKAPMAPAVPRKGNQRTEGKQAVAGGALPPQAAEAFAKLAALQAEALKSSTWVGDKFAERSREMHYGESHPQVIHGQATPDQARALIEEGITVAPLLIPVAPPDELN
jgi:hypothetical protein